MSSISSARPNWREPWTSSDLPPDTDVISEVRKPRPNPGVISWFGAADERALRLSVLVVGEIRNGVERLRARDTTGALGRVVGRWPRLESPC